MDDLDAGLFQRRQPFLRVVAGGLDDLHAAFDDRLDIARIVGRRDRRQEGEVHAERLVGHLAAARDFLGEQLGRALGQAGDDAEAAGVGDRRGQFGEADKMHAALDDRVLECRTVR